MARERARGAGRWPGGTAATAALTAAGVAYSLHAYVHEPRAGSFGQEAAEALGLDPDRVLKTLVVQVDGRLVVAVVPVSGRLDLKAVAAAVGGRRAAMAAPADAERTTGYVVGGISPVGQKRPHPTVVDSSALGFDTVYVSGGRRGLDLALSPADLVRVTAAVVAPLRRPVG